MLGIHFCTPRGSLSREFVIVRFLSLFLLARTVLTSSKEHVHIKDGFLLSQHTSIEFPEQLELHRATSDLLTSDPEEKFASMKLRTEKISEPDLFWRHYAHHLGVLPEDMRPHLHANRIPSVRINPYSKVEYKTYQQYLNGRRVWGSDFKLHVGAHGGVTRGEGYLLNARTRRHLDARPLIPSYDATERVEAYVARRFGSPPEGVKVRISFLNFFLSFFPVCSAALQPRTHTSLFKCYLL